MVDKPASAIALQAEQAEPPYTYIYEWDGPFGVHQSTSSARYNGMAPHRSIPVYLAARPSEPPKPTTEESKVVEPVGEREQFEAWWEQFAAEHEEWRFADSHALRWQAWQAARSTKGTK